MMIFYTERNFNMFNGIIYQTGKIKLVKRNKDSFNITLETNLRLSKKDIGSSISCNGVCLTESKVKGSFTDFYISNHTL